MGILLLLPACGFAQGEQWDTYMGRYGKQPGSVLVNMALMQTAPDKKYPYLLITGPKSQKCGKAGIPDTDEIPELEGILDATSDFVTGVTAKVLAGTFTYNCDRLNYYYIKDTMGVRSALGRMYSRSYGSYSYTIKIKHDPQWISYRTFLYPDSASLKWMSYSKAVREMMEHGDSLKKERDINFDFYFRSDTDRSAFASFARSKGYRTDELAASKSAAASFELIVKKYGYVKMDLVLGSEEELSGAARKYHGFYDSWTAPAGGAEKK